jgi:hypothetical protein
LIIIGDQYIFTPLGTAQGMDLSMWFSHFKHLQFFYFPGPEGVNFLLIYFFIFRAPWACFMENQGWVVV